MATAGTATAIMPAAPRILLCAATIIIACVVVIAIHFLSVAPYPPLDDQFAVDNRTCLRKRDACPRPSLRLHWLPKVRASKLSMSSSAAAVLPVVLLHEPHVGEAWLLRLLHEAGGAVVMVASEKRVREAAKRWLDAIARAASASRTHNSASSSSARPTLLILAIRPQALRILNTGMPKTPVCVLGVPTRERSQSLHPASHEGAC